MRLGPWDHEVGPWGAGAMKLWGHRAMGIKMGGEGLI